MRKQYRYGESTFGKYWLEIYHDGERIECNEWWNDDLFDEELCRLRSEGYTYGYTEKEIANAKERYEHMSENAIRREGNE